MDHTENSWPLFKESSLSVVIWNCLFIKGQFCFPLHVRLGVSWKVVTLCGSSHSSFIWDDWQRLSNNMILAANSTDFCPRCTQYSNMYLYMYMYMYMQGYTSTYTVSHATYVYKRECKEIHSHVHVHIHIYIHAVHALDSLQLSPNPCFLERQR